MLSQLLSRTQRVSLLLISFAILIQCASALTQTYCSSQNTGTDNFQDTYTYQSNGHCYDECKDDFAFAIVQGKSCWCSNYAPSDQQDVSNCDTTCPGYGFENCGSTSDDLFGYLKLTIAASGTQGASSATATSKSQTTTSSAALPSSAAQATTVAPDPETVISTVTQSASVVVSFVTKSSAPTSTQSSSSSSSSSSTTESESSTTSKSSSSSSSEESSSSSTKTSTPTTQVTVVTVGGSVVTQTVTSMPAADGDSSSGKSRVSGGQIAGAVIGGLAGFALLAGGIVYFLMYLRRKQNQKEGDAEGSPNGGGTPQRNVSTLSRTGLLKSSEKDYNTATLPPINTRNSSDPSDTITPISERRNSRPLFHDQRLNPQPFMTLDNGSHASVVSIEDNRDYTRTLNVRNPDPPERTSRESW